MKKKLICLTLAAAMLSSTAGAAFIDIKDPYINQSATALSSLGILSGVGGGRFEPDRALTRAEFTRLAVAAMGETNVDNYRSFTIFPDVPLQHWASGWVNAAMRHPKFEDNRFIRGFGDGTFGPDKQITLGESCTMLLRLMGYEPQDIGPFWPNDYVLKAQSLGILNGIQYYTPNDPISRASAAVLFRNTLTSQKKDGTSMLTELSGSAPIENAILVATGATDPSLTITQARFFVDGEIATYTMATQIDASLIGGRGVIIFDQKEPTKVGGFLPDQSTSQEVTVTAVKPEGIETEFGFIKVPRKTPLVVLGEVVTYGEGWFDLPENGTVSLFYDRNHNLQMISSSGAYLSYPTIIMGLTGDEDDIPSGWTIEKNGKEIREKDLDKYDVITLNSKSETAIVSDTRITGLCTDAYPSFRYPETITVLGTEFQVAEQFASNFDDAGEGERVTLLFDAYKRVVAAVPGRRAEGEMSGVMVSYAGGTVTVRLDNGITISGPCFEELDSDLIGQHVTVTQDSDGYLSIEGDGTSSRVRGDWDIDARTLGRAQVSPRVQIYEQTDRNSPLNPISITDIKMDVVPSSQIASTVTDSSGVVVTIILKNVTGGSWIYGMAHDATIVTEPIPPEDGNWPIGPDGQPEIPEPTYDYRVKLTTLIDGKSVEREFLLAEDSGYLVTRDRLVGLPRAALENEGRVQLSIETPHKVDTVSLSAFSGYTGVSTKKGFYPIAADVPVYVEKTGRCITLRQAKADYDKFEVYADKDLAKGGQIRIIVV